jgi:putative transposase
MEIRKGRHVVYMLHAHLVFVTKRRARVTLGFTSSASKKFSALSVPISVCPEFNGEPEHVHLLVIYPPKVRLSELVNSVPAPDEAGISGDLDTLERAQESGCIVVPQLFRWLSWRRADLTVAAVHRRPERWQDALCAHNLKAGARANA